MLLKLNQPRNLDDVFGRGVTLNQSPDFFFFTFETDKEILLYSPALSNIDQEGLILVTGLVKLWTYSNIFNLLKYKTRTMYQIFMLASLMVGFAGD